MPKKTFFAAPRKFCIFCESRLVFVNPDLSLEDRDLTVKNQGPQALVVESGAIAELTELTEFTRILIRFYTIYFGIVPKNLLSEETIKSLIKNQLSILSVGGDLFILNPEGSELLRLTSDPELLASQLADFVEAYEKTALLQE